MMTNLIDDDHERIISKWDLLLQIKQVHKRPSQLQPKKTDTALILYLLVTTNNK